MEDHYNCIFNSLFDAKNAKVLSQAYQENIAKNIESYLDDNTESCEPSINVFNHIVDSFTINWEKLSFKENEYKLVLDEKDIVLLIKDKSLLYFINNVIELSISNQLMLPKTILYDIYKPLKQYLKDETLLDTNHTWAYRLLKNLVKHGHQLFNTQFSYKDVDMIDLKLFLDLNNEFDKQENNDFVLIKNSHLLVEHNINFNYLKFHLQFPQFNEKDFVNVFTINSMISNLNVLVGVHGISIVQSETETPKSVEVYQQDFSFDSSKTYTFVIERKDDMIKLYMEEVPMSFCFYKEQMEYLYLGKEKSKNTFIKCFSIMKSAEESLDEIELLDSYVFTELTIKGFLESDDVFRSLKNKQLKRIYEHCDIFKKVINFANSASPDVFFKSIYEELLTNRDTICFYDTEKEPHLMKKYLKAVFLMINEKLLGYDKADNVFKTVLEHFLDSLETKNDDVFLKHCFICLTKWSHINESYYKTLLTKVFDPSSNESISFEFELVEWIETNIIMFDNFLDTLSMLDLNSINLKKAISNTLQNVVECILSAKNLNLLVHMMQKCVYFTENNTNEGHIFSTLLINTITKAITNSDKQSTAKTISPVVVEIAFLLVNISSSKECNDLSVEMFEKSLLLYCVIVKSTPEIHAQFKVNGPLKLLGKAHQLDEEEKFKFLNSFCKVICFSSFGFKLNETLFLDFELMTECDVSIFKYFENEYTEFHLLLIKIFTISDSKNLPFIYRYHEIIGSLVETANYRKIIFDNECRVMISLITLAMVEENAAAIKTKEFLIKFFKLSVIYLPNDIFSTINIVMNGENYETGYRNLAGVYKKWIIFEVLPKLLEELMDVHSSLLAEDIVYCENFKTLLQFVGTIFTVYEFDQKTLINLSQLVFNLLNESDSSKYQTLAAKLLSVVCCGVNIKKDEVAMLVISNQHIILTEDAFTPYIIQIFEFMVLNYINTSENKDEKFAFIRLQMSTIQNSYNTGFMNKISIFTGGDFPIKTLLNKMNKLDDSEIIKTLIVNEQEFSSKLVKKSSIYIFEDPNFVVDLEIKKHDIQSDTLIAKMCIESFTESIENLTQHIMSSEAKNLQIRNIDIDDEAEDSKKFIRDCDYYMFKIKNSHEALKEQSETFRLKIHRSTNSLMQRKIFTPNKLVKDVEEATATANVTTEYPTKPQRFSNNINQNSRVIKKLALNESIKHIWNTCIIVGANIESGVLILTDKNVLFYNQYFYREKEGAIIKRHEMTPAEEKMLLALSFEESYSKNKGDIEPEVFISVSKSDILYSLKRVFLFKDIACEFSDKNNYSYFVTFANKTMRDSFYYETNTSLVFTSLKHNLSISKNLFEVIFEGINIESSEIINKNGIGNFSFKSKLTSVFHSLVSEDYKLEKITSDWTSGKISNFFYLLALNFYAGRSFNDITQYPIFPWVISDYTSEEIDLDNSESFRDLSKPMGCQDESRMDQFVERFKSMEELDDERTPPFHYGTHYSSAMIVASYLIRIEPYTTSFKILQGGSFGPPDRIFNSIERSWISASKQLSTDVRELIPEFYFLPEFLDNINNADFGISQSGAPVREVHLPKWSNGSSSAFVYKNLEALESDYVSDNLHNWIDLVFGYKQRGQEAVDAVNVFNQLSYSGYNSIQDSVSDDFNLANSVMHNFGQTPLQLFISKHPKRSAAYFNKGIISLNKEHKQVQTYIRYFYEALTNFNEKGESEFALNSKSSVFINTLGGLSFVDKEQNIHKQLHGHYNEIKKMAFLPNYNILLSLDNSGICLKWMLTEYDLIGNLKPEFLISDFWASDNTANLIVKRENSESYDLININGTVLCNDILGSLSFEKVLGFAVISNDLKVAFSDIIDYVLVYNDGKIELYQLKVSTKGEFQMNKCLVDIDFDIKDVANLQAQLDRDTENKSHLSMKIQYQKCENNIILNYEL